MTNKPYHHLAGGRFQNPEGSPIRSENVKWSYSTFNKEKKKLDMTVPEEHVIKKDVVLKKLNNIKDEDYIGWIGHATFLIKLGNTTIITDPVFSKNAGPLIFGPKRYTDPALSLNELPKIDLLLLTHNHYDHQDMNTIRKFPYKTNVAIMTVGPGTRIGNHTDDEGGWRYQLCLDDGGGHNSGMYVKNLQTKKQELYTWKSGEAYIFQPAIQLHNGFNDNPKARTTLLIDFFKESEYTEDGYKKYYENYNECFEGLDNLVDTYEKRKQK